MSHPTCCCCASLDRCDRCDLLVGLEGFHLMSVARTPGALVLDVESCNQLAGCPGCGVIAQGHGRMVVEVIDAPWAGIPTRIRWHKRRWICREHACQTVTFLEHDERVCAPRARLGVRARKRLARRVPIATLDPLPGTARTTPRSLHYRGGTYQCRSHRPLRPASARHLLIKPHPPTADAWTHTSLSAYQRVPSPKSLAWVRPYARRRTHSTPTSTQPEPTTHPTGANNAPHRSHQRTLSN